MAAKEIVTVQKLSLSELNQFICASARVIELKFNEKKEKEIKSTYQLHAINGFLVLDMIKAFVNF